MNSATPTRRHRAATRGDLVSLTQPSPYEYVPSFASNAVPYPDPLEESILLRIAQMTDSEIDAYLTNFTIDDKRVMVAARMFEEAGIR